MKSIIVALGFIVILSGCEGMSCGSKPWCESMDDDGIPRVRSQRDADAYNATVSSSSERIICERERVIGSNIQQLVCLTVDQRAGTARAAREIIETRGR